MTFKAPRSFLISKDKSFLIYSGTLSIACQSQECEMQHYSIVEKTREATEKDGMFFWGGWFQILAPFRSFLTTLYDSRIQVSIQLCVEHQIKEQWSSNAGSREICLERLILSIKISMLGTSVFIFASHNEGRRYIPESIFCRTPTAERAPWIHMYLNTHEAYMMNVNISIPKVIEAAHPEVSKSEPRCRRNINGVILLRISTSIDNTLRLAMNTVMDLSGVAYGYQGRLRAHRASLSDTQ